MISKNQYLYTYKLGFVYIIYCLSVSDLYIFKTLFLFLNVFVFTWLNFSYFCKVELRSSILYILFSFNMGASPYIWVSCTEIPTQWRKILSSKYALLFEKMLTHFILHSKQIKPHYSHQGTICKSPIFFFFHKNLYVRWMLQA